MSANQLKQKNKQIYDLQQKIHKLKLIDRVENETQGTTSAVQDLAMAIINPDGVGGFRYPDVYSEPTSVYKAIGNFFLPFNLSSGITRWPEGSFYAECRPELDGTIVYMAENPDGTARINWTPSDTELFGPYLGQFKSSDQVVAPLGSITSFLNLPFFAGNVQLTPTFLSAAGDGVAADGWYYNPCVAVSGNKASHLNFRVRLMGGGTISTAVTIEQVDSDGLVLATVTHTYTSTGVHDFALALANSPSAYGSWGLRMTVTNNATSTHAVIAALERVTGYYARAVIGLVEHPLPDISSIISDFEKFRVTAQSMLITYFGSTLTNAGFISSILYRGGHPAQFAGLYDYSSLAEHPQSYDGALRDGTYGYWEPMDAMDMAYQCPQIVSYNRHKPYLVAAGLYNGDPTSGITNSANLLRCRVITQIEFTSRSQIYDSQASPVCPEALAAAALVVQGVPNTMENGKHLAKLKHIAGKAGKIVMSLGKFAWNNRHTIEQLAKAASPLLL